MELKQLQYFRAVARWQSISQAADSLYITQPALSRCIKRLEAEVGMPLFARTSNGVRLTPSGEAFLIEVDQLFLHLEQGLGNARMIARQEQPGLKVSVGFEDFDFAIVEQMHYDFPDVQTHVDILPPDQAYRELLAGKMDFALVPDIRLRAGIRRELLISEEMFLMLPETSPWYGRPEIPLKELDGLELVCNEVAYDWDSIERVCMEQHISMKLLFSGNDHQTVGHFRRVMQAALFIPASALARFSGDERHLTLPARIVPQVFTRSVHAAWPEGKRLSEAEKHFLDLLRGSYRRRRQQVDAFLLQQQADG